ASRSRCSRRSSESCWTSWGRSTKDMAGQVATVPASVPPLTHPRCRYNGRPPDDGACTTYLSRSPSRMFFRNLTLFRFSPAVAADLERLEEALDEHRLHPCGPLEMSTRGAVSPFGSDDDQPLTHARGHFTLLCVGSEDKLLPAAVVNQELTRKVREIAEQEGRPVGGRERKRIKAQVLDQL